MSDFLGILVFISSTVPSLSPPYPLPGLWLLPLASSLAGLKICVWAMPHATALFLQKYGPVSPARENPWDQCGIHPTGTTLSVLVVKIPSYFYNG